ncbi:MAG: hypothetical protein EBR01_02130 [Proteobacteria bacterium]|nr:hypothetical protein [Pseudomonadota bacterium]
MVSKSILLRILLVFLSNYSCFSWGDNTATERGSHRGQTELVSPVERIGTVEARPIQEVCPDDEKEFDPKLVDFRGKKIRLGEAEGKRPTLVIIASADSKDRVLKFLAEFAKPVWQERRTGRIYESVKDHTGTLIYDAWSEGAGNAWKKFKTQMGKLDDLRLVILADARPLYKARLEAGLEEARLERERAIMRGRREGARRGAQIGAEKGREYGLPIFKDIFGVMEGIGRQKGREEGARRGAQLANEVADTFIPPYVTYMAEKELLKKSDELLPSVKKVLENKLVKDFEEQCSLSILIDEKDFSVGVNEANRDRVEWANQYMSDDKKIDVQKALDSHREFLTETNSVDDIMPGLLGHSESGFHVLLISPNGSPIKSWSNDGIVPEVISTEYLKYLAHFKGERKIPGCP